jgi:hypothetical protein
VVLFKLSLLGYLFNITSERRLCQEAALKGVMPRSFYLHMIRPARTNPQEPIEPSLSVHRRGIVAALARWVGL